LDDDAVFMSSFIPRSLSEVYDPERDVEVVKAGKGDQLIYAGLTGLKETARSTTDAEVVDKIRNVRFEDEEEAEDEESDDEDVDGEDVTDRPRGFRHEDRDAKKVRAKPENGC